MNRQFERYLQMTLIVLDLFVLNILYFLCELLLKVGIPSDISYSYLEYLILSNLIWILLSYFLRTYADKVILNFEYFTKRTIQVYLIWIILMLFYLFFFRQFRISRIFVVSTLTSFGFGLLVNRFLYLGIKKYFK